MKVITKSCGVPVKMWADEIEEAALDQAITLSNLPFVFRHVALMPDCHLGFGMPIGGVLATKGVVIPNAVGVDIGCGMGALKTSLKVEELSKEALQEMITQLKKVIPVGFNHQSVRQQWVGFDTLSAASTLPIIEEEMENARFSLGTLGGGNHFLEFQKGSDGYVWVMIHSGSRNLGYKIAKYYNAVAQKMCDEWYSDIPKSKGEDGLAFLPIGSVAGKAYINAMNYALEFAKANRAAMFDRVREVFSKQFPDVQYDELINIHHNFAAIENHFGRDVVVHRKGATKADKGRIGIIPGSQGTASYIVEGLGNKESFCSCSHGAGRKMSRTQAIKDLNLEKEIEILNAKGVIHGITQQSDLDEASSAYKDIDLVMEQQKDLVKIKVKLEPLAVMKG